MRIEDFTAIRVVCCDFWRVSEWLAATLEMWCLGNRVASSNLVPSAL